MDFCPSGIPLFGKINIVAVLSCLSVCLCCLHAYLRRLGLSSLGLSPVAGADADDENGIISLVTAQ